MFPGLRLRTWGGEEPRGVGRSRAGDAIDTAYEGDDYEKSLHRTLKALASQELSLCLELC
jgi:hypothetical protein